MGSRSRSLKALGHLVGGLEPPSCEEERALVLRVAAGDAAAEAELVARNLRLVLDLAGRYQTPGADLEDMVQEGAIGLLRAARRFDPARGTRFSTFAHWWIRQGISRFVKGPTRIVRLPEYLQDRIARVLRTRRELSRGRDREADPDEVAGRLGTTGREVQRLLEYSHQALSLEASVGAEDGLVLGGATRDRRTRSPEDEVHHRAAQAAMVAGLRGLPRRQTQVLAYRYGLADGSPRSRPWIGSRLGLSAERVRQLERQALRSLRGGLDAA